MHCYILQLPTVHPSTTTSFHNVYESFCTWQADLRCCTPATPSGPSPRSERPQMVREAAVRDKRDQRRRSLRVSSLLRRKHWSCSVVRTSCTPAHRPAPARTGRPEIRTCHGRACNSSVLAADCASGSASVCLTAGVPAVGQISSK